MSTKFQIQNRKTPNHEQQTTNNKREILNPKLNTALKKHNAKILPVGLVQMKCAERPAENLERALELTREAAQKGAKIVCLPELFRSRYFCQEERAAHFELAEPIPGPSTEVFTDLARDLDITLIVSLFERRAAGLYHNTAAVIDGRHGLLGIYRKMHIPDDPKFYEKFYFTPGDLGFKAFETENGKLGTLICWDQWFPEAARLTAMQGAEILFYPTAIGWHPEEKEELGEQQHGAWEVSMRAHAVANGCYVVAVNRIGFEPTPDHEGEGLIFWGQSFVAAPDGTIVYRAPIEEEAVSIVPLNMGQVEALRHGWPFFRDRRIDAYESLTRRFID